MGLPFQLGWLALRSFATHILTLLRHHRISWVSSTSLIFTRRPIKGSIIMHLIVVIPMDNRHAWYVTQHSSIQTRSRSCCTTFYNVSFANNNSCIHTLGTALSCAESYSQQYTVPEVCSAKELLIGYSNFGDFRCRRTVYAVYSEFSAIYSESSSAMNLAWARMTGKTKWSVSHLQLVRSAMDVAKANGLNVIRAFATAVDGPYTMETNPGVFNEAILRGLDYVLDTARQRGLKVHTHA